jgi:hypothetical protein
VLLSLAVGPDNEEVEGMALNIRGNLHACCECVEMCGGELHIMCKMIMLLLELRRHSGLAHLLA